MFISFVNIDIDLILFKENKNNYRVSCVCVTGYSIYILFMKSKSFNNLISSTF